MKNFDFLNLGTMHIEIEDDIDFDIYNTLKRSIYNESVRANMDLGGVLNRKLNED